MLPSSDGRLLILLDERSRYTRLCSLAMSGGMRDSTLSLRCRAVRWVRDHRAVLRLFTRPAETVRKRHRRHQFHGHTSVEIKSFPTVNGASKTPNTPNRKKTLSESAMSSKNKPPEALVFHD